MNEFQIGQSVLWRGGFGNHAPRIAKIVSIGEKNGEPVYDLDNGHWAYGYQLKALEGTP